MDQAKASQRIFAPLCDGRLYLRNAATGHRTNLEATTEFLREHVWGGEKLIGLGHILLGDMHRETGKVEAGSSATAGAKTADSSDLPLPAHIDPKYADRVLTSSNLGIDLEGPERTGMTPGAWYAASGNPGVYVSILQPNLIDPAILQSYKTRVNSLDNIEASALCYLIAFDLDRFELGYALGTEHPKVGWSDHMLSQMRDPKLPGPDGIGSIAPLISTGLVGPWDAPKTVATFTGGFKRDAWGVQIRRSRSAESRQPLWLHRKRRRVQQASTRLGDDSCPRRRLGGNEDLGGGGQQTAASDQTARQNGVPVIEFDEASHSPAPGALVNRWGPGNWSDRKR